jgi:hypothetical protein
LYFSAACAGTELARFLPTEGESRRLRVRTTFTLALSACGLLLLLTTYPAYAADTGPDATSPCGKLVGPSATGGTDTGFALRTGEAVDFISGGQATHGKLLVFSEGPLFHAYWQPQGSEEKYALANAAPNGVRLISTPPQGTPASDGKPGTAMPPLRVLSCPKL